MKRKRAGGDAKTPYASLPDHCFWRRAVSDVEASAIDPMTDAPFQVKRTDRVATAGSCFAQHVARHLQASGFQHFLVEPPHPLVDEETARAFNYGIYSARFGNVYTSRQLLQLFDRAYGRFTPQEDFWEAEEGRVVDPFRPGIQPEGFRTREELIADRRQHLDAVRRMFEELDVFVFTLGLTECWTAKVDGAALPLAPGVCGGRFDRTRYALKNLGVADVEADLLAFVDRLREVNPRARVIFTVSPVPLMATAIDRHVLVSTTYSKSVLRVACGSVVEQRSDVAYFPAYEIVTGSFSRGAYFAEDLRSVTEAGVAHVMQIFLKHFADLAGAPIAPPAAREGDPFVTAMRAVVDAICEEEALDPAHKAR